MSSLNRPGLMRKNAQFLRDVGNKNITQNKCLIFIVAAVAAGFLIAYLGRNKFFGCTDAFKVIKEKFSRTDEKKPKKKPTKPTKPTTTTIETEIIDKAADILVNKLAEAGDTNPVIKKKAKKKAKDNFEMLMNVESFADDVRELTAKDMDKAQRKAIIKGNQDKEALRDTLVNAVAEKVVKKVLEGETDLERLMDNRKAVIEGKDSFKSVNASHNRKGKKIPQPITSDFFKWK